MNYPLRALMYFMVWGIFYGILLGTFAGTATIPIYGTMVGPVLGLIAGIAGGAIAGVTAAATGAASVDLDTDLTQYRKRVARRIGASVVIIPLMLLTLGGMIDTDILGLGIPMILALPWGALSAAYVAHRFPDVMVKETIKAKRGYGVDHYEGAPESQASVSRSINSLWQAGRTRWGLAIGAGLGLAAALIHPLQFPYNSFMEFLVAAIGLGVGGGIAAETLWAYISIGTGSFITFMKRLVFQDYFPHLPANWTRNILTAIAFIFTLGVTWWSIFFAPVCAALAAYHTYHTLALPDEGLEKTKRKEKHDMSLKHNLEIIDEPPLTEDDLTEDEIPSLSDLLK